MSAANAAALACAAGGYFAYSRILTPADFALYAGAMAIAKLGTALLDGGIKLALIREGSGIETSTYRSAFVACALLAILGTAVLGIALTAAVAADSARLETALVLFLYATAYFATYPLLVIPLADLERTFRFGTVARAEGFTACVEYGLPALLWMLVAPGFWAFIVSVWAARLLRVGLLIRGAALGRTWLGSSHRVDRNRVRSLLGFGFHFQLAAVSSVLRDSLHLVLVGPMFGREVVGLYAWVLQLCGITSQVFVQTATRVSVPALVATADDERWRRALDQITWLSVLTFPPLLCLQILAPAVDHVFFADKWAAALPLLPFLICRMLPGLATTPLGSILIVQEGSRGYAWVNLAWALAELGVAVVCLRWIGASGLAWSYAVVVWFGLALFAVRLRGVSALLDTLRVVLLRPSVWIAVALTAPLGFMGIAFKTSLQFALLYSLFVCLVAGGSEPCVREWMRGLYVRRTM